MLEKLDEFLKPSLPPWMHNEDGNVCISSSLDGHHFNQSLRPWAYILGCTSSLCCCVLAVRWHSTHMAELRAGTRPSGRRGLFMLIIKLGPLLAITSTIGAVVPALHKSLELLVHIYVSVVMWAFLELLFLMTVQHAQPRDNSTNELVQTKEAPQRGDVKGATAWEQTDLDLAVLLDPQEYFATVHASLKAQPPLRMWAVPPLGCCFLLPCFRSTPCGRETLPDVRLLAFTRRILISYMTIMPSVPLIRMVLYVSTRRGGHPLFAAALALAEYLLSILALYALFICYRVTHHLLHDFHTTSKFVAIKAIIVLLPPQRQLVQLLVGEDGPSDFWLCCLQALEAPFLCWLLAASYPRRELLASRGTTASTAADGSNVPPLV